MYLPSATILALMASSTNAFVPRYQQQPSFSARSINSKNKPLGAMVDPSMFHDMHTHFDSIQSAFSSIAISDEEITAIADTVSDAVAPAVSAISDAVTSVPPEAADVAADASQNSGFFGFLTGPIEFILQGIHAVLVGMGMDENSWGISIVAMTVIIKLVTYPLTKTQLESTTRMQQLQPEIKGIQAKYQSNPEVMNQKIAEVYQTNQVNPLAGCLPAIVQLPVFIGLYRAVLDLAKENKLDQPFLFLPNLEGPTYGADPSSGSDWLFKNWVDGVPSLGWEDTAAFLSIPIILVVSQSISQKLMQPKDMTPEQEAAQNNIVLKLLPLLIGWFSINVPAALGVYWITNNFITTALSVQIRTSLENNPPVMASSGAASTTVTPPTPTFTPAPLREKPSGFATAEPLEGEMNVITDAEIIENEDEDVGFEASTISDKPKKKRRGKKGKKKN